MTRIFQCDWDIEIAREVNIGKIERRYADESGM